MRFPKPVKSTDPWIDFCPSEYYVKEQVDVWREAICKRLQSLIDANDEYEKDWHSMMSAYNPHEAKAELAQELLEWLSE